MTLCCCVNTASSSHQLEMRVLVGACEEIVHFFFVANNGAVIRGIDECKKEGPCAMRVVYKI